MAEKYSKGERAALIIRNRKVEKFNAYYIYHQEVIDEYLSLQKEVSDADNDYYTAKINTMNINYPAPGKKKK